MYYTKLYLTIYLIVNNYKDLVFITKFQVYTIKLA